jgi:hypothetical protein
MKNKCPRCNGCLVDTWIETKHYLFCDFCRDYYDTNMDGLIKVNKMIIDYQKEQEQKHLEPKQLNFLDKVDDKPN